MKIIKRNRGLTLIEIVVSLAILGIIITPLATLLISSVRNNVNAEDRLKANQLAQRYTERIMNNITHYIIPENHIETYEGDFHILGTTEPVINSYINSPVTMPTFHSSINASEANNSTVNITDEGSISNIYLGSTFIGNTDSNIINIRVNCNVSSNVTLNISNNTTHRVNIYKLNSSSAGHEVTINTTVGEVYTYENMYDSSVTAANKNMVYRIRVTVSHPRGTSTELVTFGTIK